MPTASIAPGSLVTGNGVGREVYVRSVDAANDRVVLSQPLYDAEGVQIFIGADNTLFNLAGCSMIVGPYNNAEEAIIGAIGVIGPTRMNYAHIIPMVDYTSKLISRLLGQQS